MEKVSIIIPAYNVENYIEKCLDSIESQTYKNIEIIIIDDGSSDNTLKLVQHKASVSNLVYIILSQSNSGQSVARNVGIRNASGQYIIFVDSDDWLPSNNVIERMVETIVQEEADFVQCSFEFVKGSEHSPYLIPSKESIKGDQILIDMLNVKDLYTSPWAKIYSNEFLKKNNLQFIEGLVNEDTGFSIIASSKASKVSFLKDIVYSSREREGSTSRSSFIRMFKTMHEIFCKTQSDLELNTKFTGQIEQFFFSRYLRSMLYNLLQTAQRSDYKTFIGDSEFCFTSTDYLSKLKYKRYLPLKHRLLVRISVNKLLFFFTARTMKILGYKMH